MELAEEMFLWLALVNRAMSFLGSKKCREYI
jgi:hypothetical protein